MKILVSHFGIKKKNGWGRTYMLARALSLLGNNVTLITTHHSYNLFGINQNQDGSLLIISFPFIFGKSFVSKGFGLYSLILKLIYITFNKFDVVHSDSGHRPQSGIPCKWHRKVYNSIYISEWWDYFGKGGHYENKSLLFKLILGRFEIRSEIIDKKKADGLVVLSEFTKNRAENLGINSDRIIKIHGGSNIRYINYIANNSQVKYKYGISGQSLTFGYIGMSEGELNDLKPFIEAFNELSCNYDIQWLTYGKKLNQSTLVKMKLDTKLHEFGWVDYFEDSDKLACTDVYLLLKEENTTNIAGWPNKLSDYIACGRPVLLNTYGDVTLFTKQFPEGIFVVDWDKKSIKDMIMNILENKKGLIEKGRRNREIAESQYSWEHQALKLTGFYQKIIQSKS